MKKDELQGEVPNLIWQRNSGELVIVVIDDEFFRADGDPDSFDPDEASLAQLRHQVSKWQDAKAIGFFPLPPIKEDVPKVWDFIQEWLGEIATPDSRIYFFVDALYGPPTDRSFETSNYFVKLMTSGYVPSKEHIAYLTKAGPGLEDDLLPGYVCFEKAAHAFHAQRKDKLMPKFMSFLSEGPHEDEIINDALEITAKQLPTAETHSQGSRNDLDQLINYLSDFNFDGYQSENLAGKLPQIEIAYVKFMARYLKASLNLEDEIQHQVAMQCVTGDENLQEVQARRQVQKILGHPGTSYLISEDKMVIEQLQEFVESDDLLRQARNKIFGEDTD